VAVVHCETTTGIINPVVDYGHIVRAHKLIYIVDAMSSFGAYPLDLKEAGIDFLISSSNKCIEECLGFPLSYAGKSAFWRPAVSPVRSAWTCWRSGRPGRGWSIPLHTPPCLAGIPPGLARAGSGGRRVGARRTLRQNYAITMEGMRALGSSLTWRDQSRLYHFLFLLSCSSLFDFKEFLPALERARLHHLPRKLSQADCFRIGHIGGIGASEVQPCWLPSPQCSLKWVWISLWSFLAMDINFHRIYRGPSKPLFWIGQYDG